tara:strand:+ start:806 stop:2020 length:1215 start_codon:yes stop_codon:yes gene_type:complete
MSHIYSKIIGASFIVAGTAMGAGMLALPLVMYPIGLLLGALLLLLTYCAATYSALLILEVNLQLGKEYNFFTSVGQVLGKAPQIITHVMFLGMLYTLIAAYLASGSQMLALHYSSLFEYRVSDVFFVFLFLALFGVLSILGTQITDRASRFFFVIKIAIFLWLLALLVPYIHLDYQTLLPAKRIQNQSWLYTVQALPVIVTSFGFHVSIPSLIRYLNADIKGLVRVMVIGAAIPLVFYLTWLFMTVGVMHLDINNISHLDLEGWFYAMYQRVHSPWLSFLLRVFSDSALITSFIGVSMGLYDYWDHLISKNIQLMKIRRYVIGGAIFIPPLAWVVLLTSNFTVILSFAAIPLVVLTVFLPIAMFYKLYRERYTSKFLKMNAMAQFNLLLFGLVVCIVQLYFVSI